MAPAPRPAKIVLLGVGNTALALADLYRRQNETVDHAARSLIYGTTRSAEKAARLPACGIQPLLDAGLIAQPDADLQMSVSHRSSDDFIQQLTGIAAGALVLVSYPPEATASGSSDRRYGRALAGAQKIVYISSTSVYGKTSGIIYENTTCTSDRHDKSIWARLAAENFWLERHACVLRAAGLYGPQTGLHRRLIAGTYRMPGDGSNFISRIHLDDLAQIIEAAFRLAAQRSLYVVADMKPSTHIETVTWLCQKLGLALPPHVPLEEVAPSLRANRQIDSSRVLNELQVALQYPTYVEGFSQCLASPLLLNAAVE